MRIAALEIKNFRGIKLARVVLPPHAVLVGANNSGKSAIAEGLAVLVGRDRMTRPLSEWDFFGGDPVSDTRFEIIATLTDFESQDPSELPEWFAGERPATHAWWCEKTATLSWDSEPAGGTKLACQIAAAGRYDPEEAEVEVIRHFPSGPCDPFLHSHVTIPQERLRDLGLFLLPANRDWDRQLTFGASSFVKALRQYDAVPGETIERLKRELRNPDSKVEQQKELAAILKVVMTEMDRFGLLPRDHELVYRLTSLDAEGILRALIPFVGAGASTLLPLARQGSATVALQSFFLILALGQNRIERGSPFTLVAEEPELHLHPALHGLLANRIRAVSTQSIVTTQSPQVAAAYSPSDVLYVNNRDGAVSVERVLDGPASAVASKPIQMLFRERRQELYDALMSGVIIVPEGKTDSRWLRLWQRVLQCCAEITEPIALTVVPTFSAAVAETYRTLSKFRADALPLVDGNRDDYVGAFEKLTVTPNAVVQLGSGASIECLSAWLLHPAAQAGLLSRISSGTLRQTLKSLLDIKDNVLVHEELVWEAASCAETLQRLQSFLGDLCRIAQRTAPQHSGWTEETRASGLRLFRATHVIKP